MNITIEHSPGCDMKTPRSPEDPTICCKGEIVEEIESQEIVPESVEPVTLRVA